MLSIVPVEYYGEKPSILWRGIIITVDVSSAVGDSTEYPPQLSLLVMTSQKYIFQNF